MRNTSSITNTATLKIYFIVITIESKVQSIFKALKVFCVFLLSEYEISVRIVNHVLFCSLVYNQSP